MGMRMSMSFEVNKTFALWSGFMPRRKEIVNSIGTQLYSLQLYPAFFFDNFNPGVLFEKWAAIEVSDCSIVPQGMEIFTLPPGLYAVFLYKGAASKAASTFRYILKDWLPTSGYQLDIRPHFEILGDKYKHEDPASEEELWIPLKTAIKAEAGVLAG